MTPLRPIAVTVLSTALLIPVGPASAATRTATQANTIQGIPSVHHVAAHAPWDNHQLSGKPKKKRSYVTPGYTPKRKKLQVTPVDAPTRPLIPLSPAADNARVLVDAAGTAHITWVEPSAEAHTVQVYCRLPRGAQDCEVRKRWPEDHPYVDVVVPLELNDDLALISSEYPQHDQSFPYGSATYLDLSVDGGDTFSPSARIGNFWLEEAAVYGPNENPSIIGITDTMTGGTRVQSYSGGNTSLTSALIGPGDQAIDGRVVNDGGTPLAAWSDLNGDGYLGRWSGNGDPNDVSTWNRAPIGSASEPWLAAGPAGAFLLSRTSVNDNPTLRKVSGLGVGPPIAAAAGSHMTVEQDGAGGVYVGGLEPGPGGSVWIQRGDGNTLGVKTAVATAPAADAFSLPRFAVRPDGGGVVIVFSSAGVYSPLWATSFGTLAPTGQPGLGQRPGSGVVGPPATVECGSIAFGAVEARTQQGCFFTAPQRTAASLSGSSGVRVATGPVDLNGLILKPNNGVQIQIDPAAKTIDTTGQIRVDLDAPGGPITLWRGELHLKLPNPQEKTTLASFDTSAFAPALKGFPVSGRVDVELTDKGVSIPVNLELPKAFGDAKGEAVLQSHVGSGLALDSLRIEIGEAFLGGPTLRDAVLTYTASQDEWYGQAELLMPPGQGAFSIAATVRFTGGAFREATAEVGLPYPGLPLFSGVYLAKVRGGFGLDPTKISVGGTFGMIPASAGQTFLVDARADLTITFGSPWQVRVDGSASVLGLIPVANTRILVTGDGFAEFTGNAGLTLGTEDLGVSLRAGLSLAFDLEREQFAGSFSGGTVSLMFPDPLPDPSVSAGDVVISSRGIGLCAGGGGFRYAYAGRDLTVFPPLGSCNLGPIDLVLTPRQAQSVRRAAALAPRGKRLQASAVAVRLHGGKHAFLHVDGEGGAPDVALVDPSGNRVDPVRPTSAEQARSERVVALSGGTQTIVSIRDPQKGTWQVVPADASAHITAIKRTESQPAPRMRSRVVRRGKQFFLRYTLRGGTALGATIRERTREGTGRVLGEIKQGKGTLRIASGGPGGPRLLSADLTRGGIPIASVQAGRYTAPPPQRPGTARALRMNRMTNGVIVTWRRIPRADGQLLRVTSGDGLSRRITVNPKVHKIKVAGIDRDDRASVTIVGITKAGLKGKIRRTGIAAPKRKGAHPRKARKG